MPEDPQAATNLPALITRQGGDLVTVLSWEQHAGLSRAQQLQIAAAVRQAPALNTETAVDMLAEAASFYGEELNRWFRAQIDEFGIETVMLAIEMLDELGIHGRGRDGAEGRERDRFALDEMLSLIETLRGMQFEFTTAEWLSGCIERLGGWQTARIMPGNYIEAVMRDGVDAGSLRRALGRPQGDENEE